MKRNSMDAIAKDEKKWMAEEEKKWMAEEDLRTLVKAEEIKSDKDRLRAAMKCRDEKMKAFRKVGQQE